MIALLVRLALLGATFYGIYKVVEYLLSDTKKCQRCDGKGWWQNTRNRDRCEWCNGSGKVPKNFQA